MPTDEDGECILNHASVHTVKEGTLRFGGEDDPTVAPNFSHNFFQEKSQQSSDASAWIFYYIFNLII